MIEEIVIGGGIAATAAVALGAIGYKHLSGVMPFLYANARINARSKYSISRAQGEMLAEKKSLGDLAGFLGETDYADCAESASNVREFHAALEKSLVRKAVELREMSPPSFQSVLDAYLKFYEGKVLKAFYRSRFFSEHFSEIDEKLLFTVGEIGEGLLQKLKEARTLADINTVMASTGYAKVFGKDYGSLEEFEVALDGFVFSGFTTLLEKLKMHDKKNILELLNTKFDITNILILIKCIVRGIEPEKRKELLVNNNGLLQGRIDSLVEASDLKALVEACEGLPYSKALEKALEKSQKDGLLSHFEVELYRLFKDILLGSELCHVQGPYPLFSYLLRKEIEVKNLMIASKGIESAFSRGEIGELLI